MVKQERALRTRDALIKSAAEGFAREGFSTASLTEISRRAGVSNGALHFHFANKAALAAAVEEAASQRLTLVTLPPEQEQEEGTALQSLVDATHMLARTLRGDVVLRAGFSLGAEPTYANRQDLRTQWSQWVESTLDRADGAGELTPAVAAEDVTVTVVATTVGMEALGAQHPEWLSRQTLTRFWRLLLPRLTEASATVRVRPEGGPARVVEHARGVAPYQVSARL
ncbi:ScbR family autoregulator-binding transcription factor [Streptomyces sp. NPDC050264]|uniref:ScbR family autoregulator-binding transcription factor n=1 Tax=Streptomyces sp. NPDC050264 TaxID=3155038 RepID=UPI003424EE5E